MLCKSQQVKGITNNLCEALVDKRQKELEDSKIVSAVNKV